MDKDGNFHYIVVLDLRLTDEQVEFTDWIRRCLDLNSEESVKILAAVMQDGEEV